ncbi:MAG: hypothetical protein ACFHX7_22540 [Pseudomonadota bacterium]
MSPPIFMFVRQTEVWLIWLFYSIILSGLLIVARFTPVWLISGIWWVIFGLPFLQFCLNVVESTALGANKVPPLTMGGMKDGRVYALLGICIGLSAARTLAPPDLVILADFLTLLIFPALLASIAMRHSLATTLNPLFMWQFIRQMGLNMAGLRLLLLSALLLTLLTAGTHLPLLASIPGTVLLGSTAIYLTLLLCRCTGALLHVRRLELGLKTMDSDEQRNAATRRAEHLERQEFLVPVLEHSRANRYNKAWEILEPRLKKDRYATEHLFYDELRGWTDRTLAHKLAQGYLARLTESNTEQAWRIYADIQACEAGNYRLASGETVLRLAETASTDAQRRIILDTLKHFDDDFPGHPKSRQALLIGADMACHLDNMALADSLFRKVRTRKGLVQPDRFRRVQNLLAHYHRSGGS